MVGDVVGQWDISILDVWRQTAELEPSEESLSTKEREEERKKGSISRKKHFWADSIVQLVQMPHP